MNRLALIALISVWALTGCSTNYNLGSSDGKKLEKGQLVCVIVPPDGSYGNKTYAGTGFQTAGLLQNALTSRSAGVNIVRAGVVQSALTSSVQNGCRYAFHPEITNWEPRVAAWSGRPTRVSFHVTVYDLNQGSRVVLQQNLEARGRIATLVSQHPQDVARQLFEQFAEQVY